MSGTGIAPPRLMEPEEQGRLPAQVQADLEDKNALTIRVDGEGDNVIQFPGEEDDQEPQERKPAFLRHDFDENLAEHLTDPELNNLAVDLLQGIDADIESRRDWMAIAEKAIDYLGIKLEEASGAVSANGTVSKVWHTLLMEASVKFWANAAAEFLPAGGPVKVRDDKPPAPPAAGMGHNGGPPLEDQGGIPRSDLAQAFEQDFNHYLTTVDRQYYRDFSRMLFSLGPMGTEFRKVYKCPWRDRPVSEWVKGANLIVSQDAADLTTAGRVTERIMMWPSSVKRLQLAGFWRDVPLTSPLEEPNSVDRKVAEIQGLKPQPDRPQDQRHTIYECYCEIDLPGFEHEKDGGELTGLPLPYRVTIDKTSRQILEIRRNWKEGDDKFQPRQRYVMYGLVPGLGFYFLGFAHMAGNLERALTAIERILIDAGMYSNIPGGLIAKGHTRQVTNDMRVSPGEWREIETGEKPIQQVAMALPYKEPSMTLMQLGDKLTEQGRTLLGAAEIPVGEGVQNVQVGTVLAMIEQSTKIMAAVHKGIHAAQAEEFELLRELFVEDPTALSRFAKTPARQWEMAQEFSDLELVPASDPNVPSQMHRIGLQMASVQLAAMEPGLYNMQKVHELARRQAFLPFGPEIWAPPQSGAAPPDPKAMAAMAKVHSQDIENQRKAAATQVEQAAHERESMMKLQAQHEKNLTDREVALIDAQTERMKAAAHLKEHTMGIVSDHHLAEREHQIQADLAERDRMANAEQHAQQMETQRAGIAQKGESDAAKLAQQERALERDGFPPMVKPGGKE